MMMITMIPLILMMRMVVVVVVPLWQAWPGLADKVTVDSCHVAKAYQRQGHGTRVMVKLLYMFAKCGTTLMQIEAPNAMAFYKKLGFSHDYGMHVCALKLSEAWVRANRL
jgi:ribosomal protein S18 acetylase RimI-like enzyme